MNNTPVANRKSIVLAGKRNSGKSTLFNRIIGQKKSIVSDFAGTTTDPVFKSMELIGYGPVRVVDTAGFDDTGELGLMRVEKTVKEIESSDLIIHVVNIEDLNGSIDEIQKNTENLINEYESRYKELEKEYIFVVNKCDIIGEKSTKELNRRFKLDKVIFINASDKVYEISSGNIEWFDVFIKQVIKRLESLEKDRSLIEGMLKKGDTAVLVVPIDSEAPEGRLILPQVQMIRACLDAGVKVTVVRDTELEEVINDIPKIDMVITDSQKFKEVERIVPDNIPLTSFSVLFARQKGDIDVFVEGARYIDMLSDGDRVLIAEACTHTVSHEDIGSVKIPALIRKRTGKNIDFEFSYGAYLPDDLDRYSLVIHCGGCMITRGNMMNRLNTAVRKNIPVTNYGIAISFLTGILDRISY